MFKCFSIVFVTTALRTHTYYNVAYTHTLLISWRKPIDVNCKSRVFLQSSRQSMDIGKTLWRTTFNMYEICTMHFSFIWNNVKTDLPNLSMKCLWLSSSPHHNKYYNHNHYHKHICIKTKKTTLDKKNYIPKLSDNSRTRKKDTHRKNGKRYEITLSKYIEMKGKHGIKIPK